MLRVFELKPEDSENKHGGERFANEALVNKRHLRNFAAVILLSTFFSLAEYTQHLENN